MPNCAAPFVCEHIVATDNYVCALALIRVDCYFASDGSAVDTRKPGYLYAGPTRTLYLRMTLEVQPVRQR